MRECKIKMNMDNVRDFVSAASKCDFDIDIFYNHFIVDAKSILGVFGLDLSQVLTVQYKGFDRDFENTIQRYMVA